MYTNYADSATLSTTTSGSMLRPLSNLQIKRAQGLCRGPANGTGSLPATLVIRADLGNEKPIHMIGLCGLNGVTVSEMNVYLGSSPGGSNIASGYAYWEAAWGQKYGQALWWMSQKSITSRYVELLVQVYGRPSGERYVDARRLLIMSGMIEPTGWNFDWSVQSVDMSTATTTPKGGVFVGEEGGYRQLRFGLSGMTKAVAKTNLLDVNGTASLEAALQQAGRAKEVVLCPRYYDDGNASEIDLFANALYGQLSEWSPIQHTGGDTYACETIAANEIPYPPLS